MLASAQRGGRTTLFCLMRWSSVFSLAVDLSLSPSLLYSVLSCILPPTPFFPCTHFPSFFLEAWLSPDRLAGDKTWSFGDVRDIWEQDGERDGGHIPTRSPSAGSVEAIEARRWVFPFSNFYIHCSIQPGSTCASGVRLASCSAQLPSPLLIAAESVNPLPFFCSAVL